VTIARRRAAPLAAIAVPVPAVKGPPRLARPAGVPASLHDIPASETVAPAGRLRRCTFRRIDLLSALPGRPLPSYEVMCLHPGLDAPIALGDVEAARPSCGACTLTGIFRPDEA
jgi:hypothetical protein